MYLAPENIPRAISVLTLGNKVILYCKCIVPEETVQGHSVSLAVFHSLNMELVK